MDNAELKIAFEALSTPLIADACLRLGVPIRAAPSGIRPIAAAAPLAGRALPVRHYGSVDIFLEVMGSASGGELLVIDNGGRLDEACVGDLTALEAQASGLAGMIVWGCHRDTAQLVKIGFPVFSCGAVPAGPQRLDPREPEALTSARFGGLSVGREDAVFADADGVLFAPIQQAEALLSSAREIGRVETRQAEAIGAGNRLRDQLHFDDYLAARAENPEYSFRKHLRNVGGAIEE